MYTLNISKPKHLASQFRDSVNGSIITTSAIVLPVLLLIGFGAYDYSIVAQAKQELKAAASTAALAAVNEVEIAYTRQEAGVDLEKLASDTAKDVFEARASNIFGTDITNVSVEPSIVDNVFKVNLKYQAKVDSVAMTLVGVDKYDIKNNQKAQSSVMSYMNFNLMFDVSGSMGVGATPEDIDALFNMTGCAFACHVGVGQSSYRMAKNANITMRVDVAREAGIEAINIIESNAKTNDHMTVGMHIYDNRAVEIADRDSPQNTNYAQLRLKLDDVELQRGYGGSNTEGSIEKVVREIPASGSGQTPTDRVQNLIILTDGIENTVFYNRTGSRDGQRGNLFDFDYYIGDSENPGSVENFPILEEDWRQKIYAPAASACDEAKEKGIRVYFINTEYIVPPVAQQSNDGDPDPRFQVIDNELQDVSVQRMIECTGNAERVIRASSPDEIISALEKIIVDLSSPLRLYN